MSSSIDDIYNFRRVDDRLATSGQPDEVELGAIAQAGYRAVVNLGLHGDPRYALQDEGATVRSLGMRYEHVPVDFSCPTRDDLIAFFAAMALHRAGPVWVHCAANKRASTFTGLFLHLVAGLPVKDAFQTEQSVWDPNPVWAAFKADMIRTFPQARSR